MNHTKIVSILKYIRLEKIKNEIKRDIRICDFNTFIIQNEKNDDCGYEALLKLFPESEIETIQLPMGASCVNTFSGEKIHLNNFPYMESGPITWKVQTPNEIFHGLKGFYKKLKSEIEEKIEERIKSCNNCRFYSGLKYIKHINCTTCEPPDWKNWEIRR